MSRRYSLIALTIVAGIATSASAIEFQLHDAEAPADPVAFQEQSAPEQAAVPAEDGGSCCDISYQCCCGPRWTFNGNAVYMTREANESRVLFSNQTTNAPLFNANQFDYDWEPGIDVNAHYHLDDCSALEVRYLWLNDFEATGSFFVPANDDIFFETRPRQSFTNLFDMDTTLRAATEFQSVELNILHTQCEGYSLVFGFRYAKLDEQLAGEFDIPAEPFTANTLLTGQNDLYGIQLGLEGTLYDNCSSVRVDGTVKGGVYYNDVSGSFLHVEQTAVLADVADAGDNLSAILEASLAATYEVNCNLSVRAGYQVLFVQGVALATEQLRNASGTINPNYSVGDNGDVLFHGGTLGVEYRR